MILLAAAAAQLMAPVPTRKNWVSPDDVPLDLINESKLYTVGIAITVGPDGKSQGCIIDHASGIPKLDAYSCRLASQRLKFRSPRVDGNASYGIYKTSLKWWVGDDYPPASRELADLYLTVSQLPENLKSPTTVRLMSAVDEAGHIYDCVAEESDSSPELVRIGCEQVLKTYTAKPARTPEGVVVKSAQNVTVSFETR